MEKINVGGQAVIEGVMMRAPRSVAIAVRRPTGEIVFENVSFGYGAGRTVFEGLNLRIAPGEFVCIVGPSGCGKSTFLKLLTGIERPDSGTIEVGETVKLLRHHASTR